MSTVHVRDLEGHQPAPEPPPHVGLRIAVVAVIALVGAGFAAWRAWPTDRSSIHVSPKELIRPASAPSTAAVVPQLHYSCTGLTCRFDVLNYTELGGLLLRWNFGDGTSRTSSISVLHTYETTGDYTASAALDSAGSTSRSAPLSVHVAALQRRVQLTAGPAGSLALTAAVTGPAQCRGAGSFQLVTADSAQTAVRKGTLDGSTVELTAPRPGAYRLVLGALTTKSGWLCSGATSNTAVVRPAVRPKPQPQPEPVQTSAVYVPPQQQQPQPQPKPQPSHYTPPPLP